MAAYFYWGDESIDLLGGWVEIFWGMNTPPLFICYIKAYNFGNFNYEIRVKGEGQATSQLFEGGFGSMRTIFPM